MSPPVSCVSLSPVSPAAMPVARGRISVWFPVSERLLFPQLPSPLVCLRGVGVDFEWTLSEFEEPYLRFMFLFVEPGFLRISHIAASSVDQSIFIHPWNGRGCPPPMGSWPFWY